MSASEDLPALGHERRDIRPGTVLAWTAGIFGLLLFTAAAMWFLLLGLEAREQRLSPPASPLADYGPRQPPDPRLQTHPWGDLARLRASEQAQLDGYGWVDREAGVVHIPIDRAMSLLVERRGGGTR